MRFTLPTHCSLKQVLDISIQALASEHTLIQRFTSIEVTGLGAVEVNGAHVYEEQDDDCFWYTKRTPLSSQEASHFINFCTTRTTALPVWIILCARGPAHGDGIPVLGVLSNILILYVRPMSRNVVVPLMNGWEPCYKPYDQTIPAPILPLN